MLAQRRSRRIAPALRAAKAKAVASMGRRAAAPRTDEKDCGCGVGISDWESGIWVDVCLSTEDILQKAEKRDSKTGFDRTFSGSTSAARNGITAPRLNTSAIPPASINRDKRTHCLRRRNDSFDQRRLRVLSILF